MSQSIAPDSHAAVDTPLGTAGLRDLAEDDLDQVVAYLHDEQDEHLNSLLDRTRLGTPEETRRRFRAAIRTGDDDQRRIAFAITLEGRFCGFTHLVRHAPRDNYSHWHLSEPRLRAGGVSTALYPHRIKLYFDLCPIERLIHQTKTRNIGVNRMLDKYVPVAATSYVERPDGAASADMFHLRYVFRRDIPRLFTIAAELSRGPGGRG
jgi:RimJ/RimL family protein N-acetyltransferase